MKKLSKLFLLLICVFSLTVWSCKPTETVTETQPTIKKNEPVKMDRNEKVKKLYKIDGCTYHSKVEGIATITMFDPSNVNEAIIRFSFEPNYEYASALSSEYKTRQVFNVDGVGKYPPKAWAIENNLLQGEQVPCVRYEYHGKGEQGTNCFPVAYDFPQFKDKNWKN